MKTDTLLITDEELISGCCKKDKQSRKQLYDRYCDLLYTTALHIVHDRDLSNDVLHDAFLQIFNDIHNLRKSSSLKAWMKKVVVHTALKNLRKLRRIEYTNLEVSLDVVIWEEPMSGELLQKALFSLPDGYRIIFSLIEIEGYKHHEVAQMLNISEGTSKSQLFHAKKFLRRVLSNHQ